MAEQRARKSTRLSRWRARRREKALRAADMQRRSEALRWGKGSGSHRGGGDGGGIAGGM